MVGSGAMDILGIREANDVDLVVSPEIYEKLKQEGWLEKFLDDGMSTLESDLYEIFLSWDEKDNRPNLKDLLNGAHIIEGVSFVDIKRLLDWKKRRKLDKDLKDIELIQEYLKKSSG